MIASVMGFSQPALFCLNRRVVPNRLLFVRSRLTVDSGLQMSVYPPEYRYPKSNFIAI